MNENKSTFLKIVLLLFLVVISFAVSWFIAVTLIDLIQGKKGTVEIYSVQHYISAVVSDRKAQQLVAILTVMITMIAYITICNSNRNNYHSDVYNVTPQVKIPQRCGQGQALLDLPTYKIMLGCDGKNLKETVDLYNLTSAEESILSRKVRSVALCMIGAKKLGVKFVLPDYRLQLMGKSGGR